MRLDPAARTAGYRLLAYDMLASTSAEALALAESGEAAPFWVVAREQSAGRGRRGRTWISPPGNLYATLLLDDPAPLGRAPELSFVAGLAVHDAIAECAPGLRATLALKWPNDVLVGGAKAAGILIEGHDVRGRFAAAIGIGVNCAHHPAQTDYPACDLASAGAEVVPDDLFCALSGAMVRRLAQWRRGDGFAAIRADWLGRAGGIGGEIRVRLPDREFSGRFAALDESGRLLLRLADGTVQAVAAGDVFPVGAAPAASLQQGRAG